MACSRFLRSTFAVVLFVLSVVARADNSPARYLDGEALANELTPWILENTDPKVRRRDHFVNWLNIKLISGDAFVPRYHPERVRMLEWMLAQPDHSIMPHQLYQQAISITGGDLQRAMMVVWDTLTEIKDYEQTRNLERRALKLVDITGELDVFDGMNHKLPLGYPKEPPKIYREVNDAQIKASRGDNLSAWYHFAGTALHAYLKGSSKLNLIRTKRHTDLLIHLEEQVLYNEFVDPKKRIEIDLAGSAFGWKLVRNLKNYKAAQSFNKSTDALNTHYLYDNHELYDESWRLKEGQRPLDYGTDLRTKSQPALILRFRKVQELGRAMLQDPSLPHRFNAVAAYLGDTNYAVRLEAAKFLIQNHEPFALKEVLTLYSHGTSPAKQFAIGAAAAELGHPDALALAQQGMRFDELKEQAMRILAHAPESPEGLELARRGRASHSVFVRAAALTPLEKMTSPEARRELSGLFSEEEWLKLLRALWINKEVRVFPLLLIRVMLDGPNKPVSIDMHAEWRALRRIAVARLHDHHGQEAQQLLTLAATDSDAEVRKVARLILRARGQDAELPPEPKCLSLWKRILKRGGP